MSTLQDLTFTANDTKGIDTVDVAMTDVLAAPVRLRQPVLGLDEQGAGDLCFAKTGDRILRDTNGIFRVISDAEATARFTVATALTTQTPTASAVAASVNASKPRMTVTWTDAAAGTPTGVEIWRKLTGGIYGLVASVLTGVQTYTDDGPTEFDGQTLAEAKTFLYELRSYKGAFAPLYSNFATAVTVDTLLNAKPTGLLSDVAHVPTTTTINITWVDGAADKVELYIDDGSGGAFTLTATINAGVQAAQFTGLTTGRSYKIHLRHKRTVAAHDFFSANTADVTITTA